jgi:hypothetical protein
VAVVVVALREVLKLHLPAAVAAAGRVLQLQQALAPLLKGFQAVMAMKQMAPLGLAAVEVEHHRRVLLAFQVIQATAETAGQESQA